MFPVFSGRARLFRLPPLRTAKINDAPCKPKKASCRGAEDPTHRYSRRGGGPVSTRFRHEIWVKLLGNVAFNPISALTHATLDVIARHPDVSKVVREVMAETEPLAAKLNIELPISIDQRMAGAEKVGAHKTSMLQDYEAGRPMEIEAVVGAVAELGERLGVAMPATRAVHASAKLLDEQSRQPAVART